MKKTLTAMAFGLIFAGHMAFALTADQVVTDLQAAGYTRVEVKVGPTQMKVEAIRGTEKLEIVYDKATGAILKREIETVRPGENTAAGVSIRDRGRDFVRGTGRARSSDDNRSDRSDGRRGRGHDDSHADDHDDDRGGDRGRGRGRDDSGDDDSRGRGRGSDD
jgi:hypothetical protein